ncbi:MAG: maleylpyruvate isomerase family mycothiol-dependent enzyme [Sporichthyaceae bacterium]
MEHSDYVKAAGAQIALLAQLLDGVDLDTAVPTCPPWDLAKLIKHVGSAHRWAIELMGSGSIERLDPRGLDLGLPSDRGGLVAWLAAGATPLAAALNVDPGTAVWTWGPGHSAHWWARRMLHETLVHHADAALALGVEPVIEPEFGCDGIDELLANLASTATFNPAMAALRGDGESLHFHARDAPGEWTITLTPDGYRWDRGHTKATVAVQGSAADLLLLIYNRRSGLDAERFTVFGDADLLERWLTCATL